MVFVEVAIGAQLQLGCRLPVQFLAQLVGGGPLHGAAVGPPIVEVVALGVEVAQGGATPHAALLEGKGGFGLRSAKIAVARVDRKSTRLNSSHVRISYAVFCLKKQNA